MLYCRGRGSLLPISRVTCTGQLHQEMRRFTSRYTFFGRHSRCDWDILSARSSARAPTSSSFYPATTALTFRPTAESSRPERCLQTVDEPCPLACCFCVIYITAPNCYSRSRPRAKTSSPPSSMLRLLRLQEVPSNGGASLTRKPPTHSSGRWRLIV